LEKKRVGWLQVSFRKTIKPSFGIKAWNITREVEAWEEKREMQKQN
jgi:hypothetical protein